MSVATEKMSVQCPQCGKQLMVPASAGGKQGRCPTCSHVFQVPMRAALEDDALPELAPLESDPFASQGAVSSHALQPISPQAYAPSAPVPGANPYAVNPYAPNPYMAAAQAQAPAKPKNYNHAFGLEQRAFDAGILGGLALMAISVAWFVGGLFFGIIFYYPPILFIIGIAAMIRGVYRSMTGAGSS